MLKNSIIGNNFDWTSVVDAILSDPDYDQTKLQDYFRQRYGEHWQWAWRRYLETGDIV